MYKSKMTNIFNYFRNTPYIRRFKNIAITLLMSFVMVLAAFPIATFESHAATRTWNEITWTEWTSNNSLPTSGNYYLKYNVTISGYHTIGAGSTLRLDLNGKSINANNQYESYYMPNGNSNFYLYDSVGGGQMYNNKLHAVYIANSGANFYMYAGTITGTQGVNDNDGYGGGVFVRPGNFYMYGGSITNNNAYHCGGGVCTSRSGNFYMYGGVYWR